MRVSPEDHDMNPPPPHTHTHLWKGENPPMEPPVTLSKPLRAASYRCERFHTVASGFKPFTVTAVFMFEGCKDFECCNRGYRTCMCRPRACSQLSSMVQCHVLARRRNANAVFSHVCAHASP
jgi:hypothetical protein